MYGIEMSTCSQDTHKKLLSCDKKLWFIYVSIATTLKLYYSNYSSCAFLEKCLISNLLSNSSLCQHLVDNY